MFVYLSCNCNISNNNSTRFVANHIVMFVSYCNIFVYINCNNNSGNHPCELNVRCSCYRWAVIMAFDVRVEREAQELADSLGVRIFTAEIIYHLFDKFIKYREELKRQKQEQYQNIAVFPCKLKVLPQYIFNSRDPIVMGVSVEAGFVKHGTPICVPSKEASYVLRFSNIQIIIMVGLSVIANQ